MDKCPKCGAEARDHRDNTQMFECESYFWAGALRESEQCLRNQLASANATIDRLPKCWRLVDGKLVQDCPVAPGMEVYLPNGGPRPGEVDYVGESGVLLVNDDIAWPPSPDGESDGWSVRKADSLCSTHAAAEAANAKEGGE